MRDSARWESQGQNFVAAELFDFVNTKLAPIAQYLALSATAAFNFTVNFTLRTHLVVQFTPHPHNTL